MSYLKIKDMDIPDSCFTCPLALFNKYGYRDCFVTDYDVTKCCEYGERHSQCPMEEIEEN